MKKTKFNNKKTIYDGITFDSKAEAEYYKTLLLLKAAGQVSKIELQKPFKIVIGGVLICTYRADFEVHYTGGKVEVVDVKGMKTAVYNLKKKLMHAVLGIRIIEVNARKVSPPIAK